MTAGNMALRWSRTCLEEQVRLAPCGISAGLGVTRSGWGSRFYSGTPVLSLVSGPARPRPTSRPRKKVMIVVAARSKIALAACRTTRCFLHGDSGAAHTGEPGDISPTDDDHGAHAPAAAGAEHGCRTLPTGHFFAPLPLQPQPCVSSREGRGSQYASTVPASEIWKGMRAGSLKASCGHGDELWQTSVDAA